METNSSDFLLFPRPNKKTINPLGEKKLILKHKSFSIFVVFWWWDSHFKDSQIYNPASFSCKAM